MKIGLTSSYYESRKKSLEEIQEEMDLEGQIEGICLIFPEYGYRRPTKELERKGRMINLQEGAQHDARKMI